MWLLLASSLGFLRVFRAPSTSAGLGVGKYTHYIASVLSQYSSSSEKASIKYVTRSRTFHSRHALGMLNIAWLASHTPKLVINSL